MARDKETTKNFVIRPVAKKYGDPARHASSVNEPDIKPPLNPNPTLHAFHRPESTLYAIARFPVWVMIRAFQEVFAELDDWKWSDDKKNTNIYIGDKYPEGLEETELKPAIITDRGPLSRRLINGRAANKRTDETKGLIVYGDLIRVSMTIHCLSKAGLEAEAMAGVVFGVLAQCEDDFKLRGVHALIDVTMQPESTYVTESEYEFQDVPVTFELQYSWAWARKWDGIRFVQSAISVECK